MKTKGFLNVWAMGLIGLAFTVGARSQLVVYDQPSTADFWRFAGFASGGGQTIYDDFVLPTTESLIGVSWSGFFSGDSGAVEDAGYFTSFCISFYANTPANFPGTLLYSTSIARPAGAEISPLTIEPTYEYSALLPTAVSAVGGVKYWISIEASLTGRDPSWYWMEGGPGDGRSVWSSGNGYFITPGFNSEFAFSLSTVPEPTSAFLLLLGLLASFRWLRRQKAWGEELRHSVL